MESALREMVLGQMAKADEKFEAAKSLLKEHFFDDAISRAYYAIFHAASAVLPAEGISAESHQALKELFGLHFVKSGKIDKKFGRILSKLKDEREDSDYDIFTVFEDDDVHEALQDAQDFIASMKLYLTDIHKIEL